VAGEEDQGKKIEELTQKVEDLEEALREVARPYAELVEQLSRFQETVQKYFRLMDLYQRYGSISIETVLPEVKDPISKDIVRVLLDKPGSNISEITEELRARRGSSSRRIVRDRLAEMGEKGIVVERTGPKEKTYELAEYVIKKWSQVLGLSK
jgi:DNA-binding HxlR family transcriptional regulator